VHTKPLSIRREGAFLGAKSGNLPLITTIRVSRDYESRPCIEPSFIAASYQEVQNVFVKAKAKVIVNVIVKVIVIVKKNSLMSRGLIS
jgi:hypothetical protein